MSREDPRAVPLRKKAPSPAHCQTLTEVSSRRRASGGFLDHTAYPFSLRLHSENAESTSARLHVVVKVS